MLALAVHYLTGRAVATDSAWRDAPEWPPHPARLFFAMVDALHAGANDPGERAALEWLECQSPPALSHSEASRREAPPSYVPVNDSSDYFERDPKGGRVKFHPEIRSAPAFRRLRQGRTFPSVTPEDPVVRFIWTEAEPSPSTRASLASLVSRVARLGHSSSLVSIRVCNDPPRVRLVPHAEGEMSLRVFDAGTLAALEDTFEVYRSVGQRPVMPVRFLNYRDTYGMAAELAVPPRGVFAEMLVFRRKTGPRLPIITAPALAQVMRAASLANAHDAIPEALSGHQPDGAPSQRPHMAFAALPNVGDPHLGSHHEDGHLLGVAAFLPRGLAGTDRVAALRAIGSVQELRLGRMGVWGIERISADANLYGLRQETWTRPSRRWSSVTPVVLDRFPGDPYGADAAEIVASSCERIGLPRPVDVKVSRFSPLIGVPPSNTFTPHIKAGMPPRFHVHAELAFSEAVGGPILIGAGRYRGFGLCRPLADSSS